MIKELFREDLKDFVPYGIEKENIEVKLDANESFLPFPEELLEELKERVSKALINRYPDPTSSKVCNLYADYLKISPQNIMAGNGSDELIQTILNAFINNKDKVMTLNPDFSVYGLYTRIAKGEAVQFLLDDDFNLDVDKLIDAINLTKPKLIFLSNPNNPVGTVIEKFKLERIIRESNCIVVLDEAYEEFYNNSLVDKVNEFDNLIILRTCSKAVGLAGIRLGFLITNRSLLKEILKVKQPFNVNSITQMIGELILENNHIIKRNTLKILEEREFLLTKVKELCICERVFETKANFVMFRFKDAEKINEKLLSQKIKVRDFKDERLKNCLRITIGNREENLKLIAALKS